MYGLNSFVGNFAPVSNPLALQLPCYTASPQSYTIQQIIPAGASSQRCNMKFGQPNQIKQTAYFRPKSLPNLAQ